MKLWRTMFALASFIAAISSARSADLRSPAVLPQIPALVVNLADFGAAGDGLTLNTAAFARGLATLRAKGGGELVVPAGFWLTGPIKLQSNLNLHLERGALIKFSSDYHLYPLVVIDTKGEKEVDSMSPIFGQDLENVAITGDGIIDGSGNAWRPLKREKVGESDWRALIKSGGVVDDKGTTWWPSRAAMNGEKLVAALEKSGSLNVTDYEPAHQYLRPRMVRLINCHKVLLQGVTFQNPPNWTLNPALSEDVSLLNVTVHNSPLAQNSDALDLESCRRAVVRDSTFEAGDDGICLKSGKDAVGRRIGLPTEDVLVEGCTVYHAHGGFVIGSEMSGGVRNIRVNNCTFIGTDIGLRFKSTRGRGGVVENVNISNVRMMDIGAEAINFNMYYGGRAPLDTTGNAENSTPAVDDGTPQFRNIHIENLVCQGAQKAIVLEGLPEMPIYDIDLKNVFITAAAGVFVTDALGIRFQNVHVSSNDLPLLHQTRVQNSSLDLLP